MDPATISAVMSGMAGMGQAAPAYSGTGPYYGGSLYVEGMRVNGTNWTAIAMIGVAGLLAWKLLK